MCVLPLLADEKAKDQHQSDRRGKPANEYPALPVALENDFRASRFLGGIRRRLRRRFTDHAIQRGTAGIVL